GTRHARKYINKDRDPASNHVTERLRRAWVVDEIQIGPRAFAQELGGKMRKRIARPNGAVEPLGPLFRERDQLEQRIRAEQRGSYNRHRLFAGHSDWNKIVDTKWQVGLNLRQDRE